MAEYVIPGQDRYIDPYQQRVFDFNTVDAKVYLSRITNMIMQTIGNDIVLKGFGISSISGVGTTTVSLNVASGFAIQDKTLINVTDASSTLTLDMTSLEDTSHGHHLAVFIDYQYLETVELNPAVLRLYHVASGGVTINPVGFQEGRCLIMLGVLEVYKDIGTGLITSIVLVTGSTPPTLVVRGTTMFERGYKVANINIYDLVDFIVPNAITVDTRDDYMKHIWLSQL